MSATARSDWALGRFTPILELASIFGCSLNGEEAKLSLAPASGLAEVTATKSGNRAVFNWSKAVMVMREKRGQFITRERNEAPMRWERRVG